MQLQTKSKVAITSVLIALAVILSYVETLVCSLIPFSIPGIRLGITNLVTMVSYRYYGTRVSLIVVLARCLISFLIIGSPWSFLMSLAGAALSFVAIMITGSGHNSFCSPVGASVLSASFHVIGQIICASMLCGYPLFFTYLPVLLLASVITGSINGIVVTLIFNRTDIIRN